MPSKTTRYSSNHPSVSRRKAKRARRDIQGAFLLEEQYLTRAGSVRKPGADQLINNLIISLDSSPDETAKLINAIVLRTARQARIPQESFRKLAAYMTRIKAVVVDTSNEPKFLTTGEAAKKLGVTDQVIINWIRAGRVRAEQTPGKHYRVYTDQFKTTNEQDDTIRSFMDRIHKKFEHLPQVDEDDMEDL